MITQDTVQKSSHLQSSLTDLFLHTSSHKLQSSELQNLLQFYKV